MRKFLILAFVFACLGADLSAQEIKPVNSNINYEITPESVAITKKPQNLRVAISSASIDNPKYFTLQFDKTLADMSMIAATLNGEQLWLIQADAKPQNNKVLAWNFDQLNGRLILYPADWQTGFELQLDVELNLKNPGRLEEDTEDSLLLEAELSNGLNHCSPSGRGNKINLK